MAVSQCGRSGGGLATGDHVLKYEEELEDEVPPSAVKLLDYFKAVYIGTEGSRLGFHLPHAISTSRPFGGA